MEEQTREEAPVYRACIGMRIKFPDGIYRDIAPGSPIPRATTDRWNNPALWVKRGHVARIDGKPEPLGAHGPYEPPRPVTSEDVKIVLERRAGMPDFRPRSLFPGSSPADIGPRTGTASEAHDPSDAELDQVPPVVTPVDPALIAELQGKSRKELIKLADALDVDVHSAGGKDDVISAIAAAAQRRRAEEAAAAAG